MGQVFVINHPLVKHKLTQCRRKDTEPWKFREIVEDITEMILYEATRNLPLDEILLETPLSSATGLVLSEPQPVFIAVLRAGLGMLSGALRIFPAARAGHIGLYRDHDSFEPVEYYCKLPNGVERGDCYLLEPMLATGGSAAYAINILKKRGVQRVTLLSLIASPEGINALQNNHPGIKIYLAAVDERLNDKGYIQPGLGDAGDRLYGTV